MPCRKGFVDLDGGQNRWRKNGRRPPNDATDGMKAEGLVGARQEHCSNVDADGSCRGKNRNGLAAKSSRNNERCTPDEEHHLTERTLLHRVEPDPFKEPKMRVLVTIVVTLVVVAALAAGFVYSGVYDVAAVHADNPLFARVVHTTSERSVSMRKGAVVVPAGFDAPDKAAAGAREYGETCVICHGGPGLQPSAIAKGLNPPAPRLYNQRRKPDPQEDFWFVANGVKMTAMPGFSASMRDDDIWNVVAFLKTLPGMSADQFSKETGLSPQTAPGGKPEKDTSTAPAGQASSGQSNSQPGAEAD
ncbi:MAG: c-type cytochrome [Devosia sp.]